MTQATIERLKDFERRCSASDIIVFCCEHFIDEKTETD